MRELYSQNGLSKGMKQVEHMPNIIIELQNPKNLVRSKQRKEELPMWDFPGTHAT